MQWAINRILSALIFRPVSYYTNKHQSPQYTRIIINHYQNIGRDLRCAAAKTVQIDFRKYCLTKNFI